MNDPTASSKNSGASRDGGEIFIERPMLKDLVRDAED